MKTHEEANHDLILKPDDIHIWFAFPDEIIEDSLLSAYMHLLPPDEQAQQQRFQFPKHRRQYLVTRALARTTLSRYTGIDPLDLHFSKNDYGRPEIAYTDRSYPVRFNLSHTDGLIACAVVLKKDIGVDVESVDHRKIDLSSVDRFFSLKEAADFQLCSRKRERFFEYWVLKESYIKARGLGLSLPLDQFSFHVSDHEPIRISFDQGFDDNPQRWKFFLFKPTTSHRAAITVCDESKYIYQIATKRVVPLQEECELYCPILNYSS